MFCPDEQRDIEDTACWTHRAVPLAALNREIGTEQQVGDGQQQRFRQRSSFIFTMVFFQILAAKGTRVRRGHVCHGGRLSIQQRSYFHVLM